MKKKLLFTLTLSLLFILALTGCGGKDDSAGQPGGNDASSTGKRKRSKDCTIRPSTLTARRTMRSSPMAKPSLCGFPCLKLSSMVSTRVKITLKR